MINHQKILFHHGYFHVHVVFKDATVMQDLNQISYVLKDYHTK